MNLVVIAAIALGLLLGAATGYVAGRRVVLFVAESASRPSVVRIFGGAAGLVFLAPSGFAAIVVGGNFGAGLGTSVLPDAIGVPLGLAFGTCAVLAVCLLAGSLSGALLGRGVSAFVALPHVS